MKDYNQHRLAIKNILGVKEYNDLATKIFNLKPGESICIDEVEYLCCSVNSHIDFAFREYNNTCVRVDHDRIIYNIILSAITPTMLDLGHVLKCTYYSYGNYLFKWEIQDANEYMKGGK